MNSSQRKLLGALLLAGGFALLGCGWYDLAAKRPRIFARVKVEKEVTNSTGNQRPAFAIEPASLHSEIEVIRSEVVLGKVIAELGLAQLWGDRYAGGKALDAGAALARLRQDLRLVPVSGAGLVDIEATCEKADEAAAIANAVADAYRACQSEQREKLKQSISDSVSRSVDSVEERWKSLGQQILETREQLDLLRREEPALEGDASARSGADPEKLRRYEELKLKLEGLQRSRQEVEREFAADQRPGPAVSCVNVDIVKHALPPALGTSSRPGRDAGLLIAGGLLCAGGVLLLRRPRLSPAPGSAR